MPTRREVKQRQQEGVQLTQSAVLPASRTVTGGRPATAIGIVCHPQASGV